MGVVLDHSAFIPCGNKPSEEKESIKMLGDRLPDLDIVWHVSTRYLKTLYHILNRELKRHDHPQPRLQSSLMRTLKDLLSSTKGRKYWCVPKTFRKDTRLRIHIMGRSVARDLNPWISKALKIYGLTDEDLEVIALAVAAARYQEPVYLVSTDNLLLHAARHLADWRKVSLQALTPRQLEQLIRGF